MTDDRPARRILNELARDADNLHIYTDPCECGRSDCPNPARPIGLTERAARWDQIAKQIDSMSDEDFEAFGAALNAIAYEKVAALRAAPADPLSVEALAEVERDLRDLHVAYRVIHGDAHGPMEYEDCGPCTSGRVALVALRASSRGAPTDDR